MSYVHSPTRGAFVAFALLVLGPLLHGADTPAGDPKPVTLHVLVPANAVVVIDGQRTQQGGTERIFESPPVAPGKEFVYVITATWTKDGKDLSRTEKVPVRAGDNKFVDLRTVKTDIMYVPTPEHVVDMMLDMAKVGKNDVIFDLGCGDGRIVIAAAKRFGTRGVGIDIDPERIAESKANARKAGVEDLVEFRRGDIFKKIDDLDKATVVALYLYPALNLKLRPILQKTLKPGSRIVSHDFDMGDWKPLQQAQWNEDNAYEHKVFLWKVGVANEDKEPKKDDTDPKKEVPAPKLPNDAPAKVKPRPPKDEPGKEKPPPKEKDLDVPYVPTPQAVVDRMLMLANPRKGDLIYDLGCGDGRIVVTAAKKYGVKAVGFDIDPERIKESLANVKKNDVEKLVSIEKKDVFTVDLSKVNVLTLYLLPEVNEKLIPQMKKLPAGARIVSHDFPIKGYKPKETVTMKAKDEDGEERDHEIFLWVAPLMPDEEK